MIFQASKWLLIQLLVGAAVVLICAGLVSLSQGGAAALKLLEIAFFQLNSLWVWGLGFGLMSFVMKEGKTVPIELQSILKPSEPVDETIIEIIKSTSHRQALIFTIPVTFMGILLVAGYGIPHTGLAKLLIGTGIVAIHYVAAFLLSHFFFMIRAFNTLYRNVDGVEFSEIVDAHRLECLTAYLGITTFLGICAIYAGFRGTLTANFAMPIPELRIFLVTPLVLFLPITLFYNYYPRYCLRRIVQYKVFALMNTISRLDYEDLKSTLLEIREATALTSQILPFVDHKTVPSYLVAILFIFSLSYTHDPVVGSFLSALFGNQP